MNGDDYATPTHRKSKKEDKLKRKERVPGKKAKKVIKEDSKYISHCVTRDYAFVYKKAKGCHVWDVDGQKFLDFGSGIAVMNTGHTNPAVVKAIKNLC